MSLSGIISAWLYSKQSLYISCMCPLSICSGTSQGMCIVFVAMIAAASNTQEGKVNSSARTADCITRTRAGSGVPKRWSHSPFCPTPLSSFTCTFQHSHVSPVPFPSICRGQLVDNNAFSWTSLLRNMLTCHCSMCIRTHCTDSPSLTWHI